MVTPLMKINCSYSTGLVEYHKLGVNSRRGRKEKRLLGIPHAAAKNARRAFRFTAF